MMKKLNINGDTIVEVLIAVAVVTFVMGAAFTSTNRSLKSNRQAQEHTKALKMAENQIEYLRSAASNTPTVFTTANYFCLEYDSTTNNIVLNNATTPVHQVDSTGNNFTFPALNSTTPPLDNYIYSDDCKDFDSSVEYHIAIDRKGTAGNYTFQIFVRWDSITGSSHDEVSMLYKLNQ